jgi:glutamine phosphoribosylpyrophosphate amidotransferase
MPKVAAHIVGTMMGVNGLIQSPDLQFQSSELIDNGLQRLFHRGRKGFAITLVHDDRGKLRETFPTRLRNETELGKVGSERIDQLRALTNKRSRVRCNISKAC